MGSSSSGMDWGAYCKGAIKMTKDELYMRLTMAQKNKKELKKIKLQLLKEIEQLKLMLRALEEG